MVQPARSPATSPKTAPRGAAPPPPAATPRAAEASEASDASPSAEPKPATTLASADARRLAKARASGDLRAAQQKLTLAKAFDADYPPSPAELQGDRRYQRLPADTRSEVLRSLDLAKDGPTRNNISRLAIDEGFAKLSPEDQRRFLEIQRTQPGSDPLNAGLRQLAGTKAYRELPAEQRATVLDGVELWADKGQVAPRAYADLLSSPEWGRLGESDRARSLDILGASPDRGTAGQLQELGGSDSFRGLPDAARSKVYDKLAEHPSDPLARQTITSLATSPGYARLKPEEQARLTDYVGGTTPVSAHARGELDTLLADDGFRSASPDAAAGRLRKLLTDQSAAPDTTTAPEGAFDGRRVRPQIGEPKTQPDGSKRYLVKVDDQEIPVVVREPRDKKQTHPKIEEVADALGALPPASRRLIKSVDYKANPPQGGGYMGCSSSGVVEVYPTDGPRASQTFVDSAMLHETGHALSGQKWGDNLNDPRWKRWKDAQKADVVIPSKYGNTPKNGTPVADDFAEAVLLYQRVKGTPEEAEYRKLMPNRFAILDEVTK